MSYDRQQPPQYHGEYDKGKEYSEPPPPQPPPPCPDPCDDKPPWGPPEIRKECCPHHPCCPDNEGHCCTWESIDDPCVKAASAECGLPWTTVTCNCSSSNPDCDCEEWDCNCYPQGTCVPCKPCEGLLPDPEDPGGCDEPGREDCTTEDLQKQLEALNRCITSQEGARTKLEEDIKARKDRATALGELIKTFPDIIKKYKDERHKLVCRENCLKGFHRDMTTHFAKYPPGDLGALAQFINQELCKVAQAQCCQKNLEGKLSKVTKLIWEQQQAQKEKDKADEALKTIQDLPGWLDKQFKELETLKDQIAQALNDIDPQKHKWAFYLFYWKFVPKLCRCFPYPFCCDKDGGYPPEPEHPEGYKPEQGYNKPPEHGYNKPPEQGYNKPPEQGYNKPPEQGYNKPEQGSQSYQEPRRGTYKHEDPQSKPPDHLGCKSGDWHPSIITEEALRGLICCAWDYARKQKQALQDANDRVADANSNLAFITAKAKADADSLDDRIKNGLNKVSKPAPTSR